MTDEFAVGTARAARGTSVRGAIPVGLDASGRLREIPVLICRGEEDGPVLWINGATHGDEPEGALSIFKLFAGLRPADLRGTVVGVPAMNVPAFEAGKRGDPLDTFSHDMNRIYPGRPDGYPTERAAWAHWQAMRDACDLQIAIHSGGEHSYLAHMIFASDNPPSLELAAAMGAAVGPGVPERGGRRQSVIEDRGARQGGDHGRTRRQLPDADVGFSHGGRGSGGKLRECLAALWHARRGGALRRPAADGTPAGAAGSGLGDVGRRCGGAF